MYTGIKLNIGSGSLMIRGFVNIDHEPDLQEHASRNHMEFMLLDIEKDPLPFADSSVEFINASQVFEHLNYKQGLFFLKQCFRVMKEGAELRISVPDMELLINKWKEGTIRDLEYTQTEMGGMVNDDNLLALILFGALGGYTSSGKYSGHMHGYTFKGLKEALETVGFEQVKKVDYDSRYDAPVGSEHSLAIVTRK